jgi:hypothetical protein
MGTHCQCQRPGKATLQYCKCMLAVELQHGQWHWRLQWQLLTLALCLMQACISCLGSLTRLEILGIKTPLEAPILDDLFAGLPVLQTVRLAFKTSNPDDVTGFDSDDEGNQQQERKQPNDFPCSLLRCKPLPILND